MRNPDTLQFAKTHEWLAPDGTVGISDHAQREITDVVFVDLPKIGKEVQAGEAICVVESVKAAFDIYAPISGKIIQVNSDVSKNPARDRIQSMLITLLCKRRKELGISMTVVAEKSGLSLSMISFVEREIRKPTMDTLLRIAEALNVDLWKLLRDATKAAGK